MEVFYSTGKRKNAVAKVWLMQGKGNLSVNEKNINEWLGGRKSTFEKRLFEPLLLTKKSSLVDIKASISGGGYSAQIDALRHAISRALVKYDVDFRAILKKYKLLTRDPRVVERKKCGKKKARKSPQFSKR